MIDLESYPPGCWMTYEEIYEKVRRNSYKKEQVGITAQLNGVKRRTIVSAINEVQKLKGTKIISDYLLQYYLSR